MTLGRILKWILVIFINCSIAFIFSVFSISSSLLGFAVGIIWFIIVLRIMNYKVFSPREFEAFLKNIQETEK